MRHLYDEKKNTGDVTLHPDLLISSFHLVSWIFLHPSAWRSYVTLAAPDLESNFCLLELQPRHWRNPALRRIFVTAYLILPLLISMFSGAWLFATHQPDADVIRGMVLSFSYYLGSAILLSLVHSVALGVGYSVVFGVCVGLPDSMGGILYAVLLAAGLGGPVAVSTAPERPTRSMQGQITGVTVGILTTLLLTLTGYLIMSGTITGSEQNAQIGQGLSGLEALTFGLGGGLVLGAAFATITRLRVPQARLAVFVGITIVIVQAVAYAFTLGLPHTNLIIHLFGGIGGSIMFTALFLLAYSLVERAAGPWAGAITAAYATGMAWLPLYDYLVFENETRNILVDLPYGQVVIAAIILAGLSMNVWLPPLKYPFYLLWNQLLYQRDRMNLPQVQTSLRWNSVFWDEFQYLPLYGLDKHLVLVYEHDPAEGQVLMHTISSSHQRWAVQAAQIELDARQLERLESIEAIAQAHLSLGTSYSMMDRANIILNTFSLISQDVQVALNHTTIFHRRLGLKAIEERLNALLRDLARSSDPYAARFYQVTGVWLKVIQAHLTELEKNVEDAGEIDNPYIVGVPLTEQQKIFVGRSDIALRLEQWLSDQRCPPLFLYGQRRMGKTSLLLNLGRLIHGGILPLFVDGQYVASAGNYREIMINTAREFNRSASRQRNIQIPLLSYTDLTDNTVIKFNDWLDQIEQVLDQHGFTSALLALDEFDALYTAARRGYFEETDFLNLLRYLLQHRPRFKVLVTSARSPNEFGDWASHLINLQVIHLGPLKAEEARQLIEHPTQDFGLAYTPEASQRVMELSGGHPFLVQLLCYEIVTLKNSQPQSRRREAGLEDVKASVTAALISGQFFFEEMQRQGIDDVGRSILKRIASEGEGGVVSGASLSQVYPAPIAEQLRHLLQRELLEEVEPDTYRFRVELIRRWFLQ